MQSPDEQERLIESLASREESAASNAELSDSTVFGLQAELETLQDHLRRPPPADLYAAEAACESALRAVRAIGRDPSFATRQQLQEQTPPGQPTSGPPPQTPGTELGILGQYRLLKKLGEGGMGTVYKALHTRLDKVVALKVLAASRLADAHAVSRFEREMRAVGKLHHMNIVAAHDAGEINGTHYLVMELVEGIDLGTLVKQRGRLPIGVACELIRQAALGLQHAHEHGLVHRDIKPSNLMLTLPKSRDEAPIVKVLDLGLALLEEGHLENAAELTSTGQVMGTLDYMAPEQGADTHSVDIRADIYSLGATHYKLLTGKAPFSSGQFRSPIKLLMALATQAPPPVSSLCPEITPELAAIIHRMLAKLPEERYATPRELAEALAPHSQSSDVRAFVDFLANAPPDEQVDVTAPTFIGPRATTVLFVPEKPTVPLIVQHAATGTSAGRWRLRAAWCGGIFVAVASIVAVAVTTNRVTSPPDTRAVQLTENLTSSSERGSTLPGNNQAGFKAPEATAAAPVTTALADRDRNAAQLWLQRGGWCTVRVKGEWSAQGFSEDNRLQDLSFELISAYGSPSKNLTSADLAHFAGLPMLDDLAPTGAGVDNQAVGSLKQITRLCNLSIPGTSIQTSALAELASLPLLQFLWIDGHQIDDDLQVLDRLWRLRVLWIGNFRPTSAHWKRFGEMPYLREIRLHHDEAPDVRAVAAFQRRNPLCRVVCDVPQQRTIGIDTVRQAVRHMVGRGINFTLSPLEGRGTLKPTINEVLDDPQVFLVAEVGLTTNTTADPAVLSHFSAIPFGYLRAPQLQNADAVFAAMPDGLMARTIDLQNSDFTDAGLVTLQRYPRLQSLNLSGTKATRAGIQTFQRSVPGCEVFSSYGYFPPGFPVVPPVPSDHPDVIALQRERAAADWWLSHQENDVWINIFRKDTNELIGLSGGWRIPDVPFCVEDATLVKPFDMTNADLERFVGLSNLQDLTITGQQLDERALDVLVRMPRLRKLQLFNTRIPTSALTRLGELSSLRCLILRPPVNTDNWSFLQQLPQLQSFAAIDHKATIQDWRRWTDFPQLTDIVTETSEDIAPDAVAEIQRKNPAARLRINNAGNPKTLGTDPTQNAARQLLAKGLELTTAKNSGPIGRQMNNPEQAAEIPLDENVVSIKVPPEANLDAADLQLLRTFSGRYYQSLSHIQAANTKQADQLLQALDGQMWLSTVDLNGSNLTDAGLRSLKDAPQLRSMSIAGTSVTAAGVGAFRDAFPECTVTSNFGAPEGSTPRDMPQSLSYYQNLDLAGERAAVEHWLQRGGSVMVEFRHNRTFKAYSPGDRVPNLPFKLTHAWIGKDTNITSADLAPLAGRRFLVTLTIAGNAVDAAAVQSLKQIPRLREIFLVETKIPLSALGELESLPSLQSLLISGTQVDDQWRFAEKLRHLRHLHINDLQPTAADWQAWSRLTQLRELVLPNANEVDASLVKEFNQANPHCRVLLKDTEHRSLAGEDPLRQSLRLLDRAGLRIFPEPISDNRPLKPTLKEMLDDPQLFRLNRIVFPREVKLDPPALQAMTEISGGSLVLNSYQLVDEFLTGVLGPLPFVRMDLSYSSLSDKGLAVLPKIAPELNMINLTRNGRITRGAVEGVAKALPECTILSDFGTFE